MLSDQFTTKGREFTEQRFFSFSERRWHVNDHMKVEIATTSTFQMRDALTFHPRDVTGLGPVSNGQRRRAIKGFDFHLSTKGDLGHGEMNLSMKIISFTLKLRIIFNNELDKEVAIWPTAWTSWSSVTKSHLGAGVNTGWNVQGE
jgi:hypothetical protein